MLKYGNGYKADKGKQFVLRTVPKKGEHTRLSVYEEGHIFKEYKTTAMGKQKSYWLELVPNKRKEDKE